MPIRSNSKSITITSQILMSIKVSYDETKIYDWILTGNVKRFLS